MLLFKSLYFFLPAYIANMSPVLFRKIPFLEKPISEKYFGSHKTWRGLIVAVIMGIIIFGLQKIAYTLGFTQLALIDYSDYSLLVGLFLGAGAILGDLVKSYYKRKAEIPPGDPWVPFDQIDFAVGGLIGVCFVFVPPAEVALIILVASPLLHFIINFIGFYLKINKKRY